MPTMKLDIIEGTSYSTDMFTGTTHTRVGRVSGLSVYPAASRMDQARKYAEGVVGVVGGPSSKHPYIDGVIVQAIDPQPESYDSALVFIKYGQQGQTVMEINGTLNQQSVGVDAFGQKINLSYTPSAQGAEETTLTEGREYKTTPSVSKLTPGATYSFTTTGATRPDYVVAKWLGKMNAGDIVYAPGNAGTLIADPNVLLCTSVSARHDNPQSETGWTRTINFTYKPDTWHGVVAWRKPDGSFPSDIAEITTEPAELNGVTVVQLYQDEEFNFNEIDAEVVTLPASLGPDGSGGTA